MAKYYQERNAAARLVAKAFVHSYTLWQLLHLESKLLFKTHRYICYDFYRLNKDYA